MKNLILLACLLCSFFNANSQPIFCDPPFVSAGNIPPGCRFCSDEFIGSTNGYTAFTGNIDFPCGTIENNFFLTIQPDSNGVLEVEVIASNCRSQGGVQMILFNEDLEPLTNCTSSDSPDDPGNLRATGLPPLEFVILMVDGFAADICDVKITVLEGMDRFPAPPAPDPIQVISPNQTIAGRVCDETEITFKINAVPGTSDYLWNIEDPGILFPQEDTMVTARFLTPGIRKITVTPFSFCQQGPTVETMIEVFHSPKGNFPQELVCPSKYPVTVDGNVFAEQGTYEVAYPNLDCDSIVTFDILDLSQVFLGLDTAICIAEPLIYNGQIYDSTGHYEVILPGQTTNICDTILTLDMRISDLNPPEVFCIVDSFLNALALRWDKIELAKEYRIFVNDELISTQEHTSILYFSDTPGEELNIRIEPVNLLKCDFPEGHLTCYAPGTVSTRKEERNSEIVVFPNPSKGVFEIFSNAPLQEIEVFDFSGKRILKTNNSKIDLTEKAAGVYFFKVKSEKGVFLKKGFKI